MAAGMAAVAARASNCASSGADSGCSTYTAARDSSALFTSNDGFSVVAPMNVRSPRSTNGRKASCCALLNRCTSSTNRIVLRPNCSRASSARATASRMSLTPASTAEIATKSALNASAIRRASVVLPTPGGPHRIIECGLPAANATASGLPGASRCRWPITSAIDRGRRRSASGVSCASSAGTANRSAGNWARSSIAMLRCALLPYDIRTLRGREAEGAGRKLRIALQVAEGQLGGLPEGVGQQHPARQVLREAQSNALELRVGRFRCGVHVFEAALGATGDQREVLFERIVAREQRRRRRPERRVELAHDHLVEVAVVDPDLVAVTDDQLVERLVVGPAKFAGTRERERARRRLRRAAVAVDDHLLERTLRALCALEERIQLVQPRRRRRRGVQDDEGRDRTCAAHPR